MRRAGSSDPTVGFTDMQWYMYHQRNVAFFAAFTSQPFTQTDLLAAARGLVALAPQLGHGFDGGIDDDMLRRVISIENVDSLDGFPDRWLDRGDAVLADSRLPLFRIRYAAARSSADGHHGFLLVQVSHALVEGADSALLSRSRTATHPHKASPHRATLPTRLAAAGLGVVLAGLHLAAGNLIETRPGPFGFATRTYPRAIFSSLARQLGVRQRALFFSLVMHTLFDAGTPQGKPRITSTYSVIDDGGGADRDSFMRMRMLFARFDSAPDFASFARAVETRLSQSEARQSGFNDEMNAQGVRMHRRLSRLLPFAYTPRLFQFMPYDVVLGLIPPHRLDGELTRGLMEPVYAGAALEGANACVVVPNRHWVTFNFYVQVTLLPRVAVLDRLLEPALISRSESVD